MHGTTQADPAQEVVRLRAELARWQERAEHAEAQTVRLRQERDRIELAGDAVPATDPAASRATEQALRAALRVADAELEARAEFVDALVETMDVAVLACDATGAITMTNRLTRDLHGPPPDEQTTPEQDVGHVQLFRADARTPLPQEEVPLVRALAEGEVHGQHVVIRPRARPLRHLLVHGRRLERPDGTVLGAVTAAHDITELQQRTAELAAERETQRQLLAGLSDLGEGVVVAEGTSIVFANEAYARHSGYTQQELLDLPDSSVLMEPAMAREWPERVRRLAAGECAVERVRSGLQRKDGSVLPMEGATTPITYDGRARRITVARDISNQVRAERELAEQRDALAAANQDLVSVNGDLAVFAAAAAHDLKNPLGSIAGFAQLLHDYDETLDERGRSMLERIERAATRMGGLVDDLLAYARAGSAELVRRPLDLDEVTARVVAEHTDTVELTGAHVEVDRLPQVHADSTLVRQLLANLLTNALKYSRPGEPPHVRIDAVQDARGVVVRVSDRGIGVPAEHQEQVFSAFHRLDNARAYPGTGLGLALCKRVVDRHGGRIGLTDSPGGGSCFWFTLAPAPAAGAGRAALRPGARGAGGLTAVPVPGAPQRPVPVRRVAPGG